MDTEALSSICGGLGYRREDEDGTLLGYVKGEYCLGRPCPESPYLALIFRRMGPEI